MAPEDTAASPVAPLELLAEAFLYPDAHRARRLAQPARGLPASSRTSWTRFAEAVGRLEHSAWEELYTRTLDLNPVAAPYVGYQLYGEDYRRGAFMADMARELERLGVATDDELSDHLAPVLRYLARCEPPTEALIEQTREALKIMARQLGTIDRTNPYRHLVRATDAALVQLAERRSDT